MRLRRRFNSDFVEVGELSVPSYGAEKQDAFQRFFAGRPVRPGSRFAPVTLLEFTLRSCASVVTLRLQSVYQEDSYVVPCLV